MDQKPSPDETPSERSQRYILLGALFPLIWSLGWGGIATAVGAERLDQPGVIYLNIALFIHIPAMCCVVPLTGLSPMSSGNDTLFEYASLMLATIPSCIFYAFVGKLIANSVNSRIANPDQPPDSNSPPNPSPAENHETETLPRRES